MIVSVRMPDDLHGELARVAQADDRPLSQYIVHLIRKELEKNKAPKDEPAEARR